MAWKKYRDMTPEEKKESWKKFRERAKTKALQAKRDSAFTKREIALAKNPNAGGYDNQTGHGRDFS